VMSQCLSMCRAAVSARTFAGHCAEIFVTPILISHLFAIARAVAPAPDDAARVVDAGAPDLVVSPAVIEWQLPERGRSQARVRVGNAGAGTLRLRASLGSWSLSGDGTATPLPAEPGGLSGRLQVHPTDLQLAPGQQRSLRVWLSTPDGLRVGEHRALLQLDVERPGSAASDRVDLAVYAWQGPVEARPRVDATDLRVCDRELSWTLQAGNDGSRHARLDGWLVVADAAGGVQRHALPRTPVLPGATQRLALTLPWTGAMPEGVRIEGRFGALDLGRVAVSVHAGCG
jgi:hypothetical protein